MNRPPPLPIPPQRPRALGVGKAAGLGDLISDCHAPLRADEEIAEQDIQTR